LPRKKPKPNSFEDWAISKVQYDQRIDLKKLWAKEEDKELDPKRVGELVKGN